MIGVHLFNFHITARWQARPGMIPYKIVQIHDAGVVQIGISCRSGAELPSLIGDASAATCSSSENRNRSIEVMPSRIQRPTRRYSSLPHGWAGGDCDAP